MYLTAADVDPIIMKNAHLLKDWASVTPEIRRTLPDEGDICVVEDKTKKGAEWQVSIWGLTPSQQIDSSFSSEFSSNH